MPTVFVKRMDEEKKHPFFIAGSQQLLDEVKIHPAFASRGRVAIGELTIGGDGFPLQEDMVFTWYPPAGRSAHEDPPGDESTSGREKAAGGVVYVQVILRQAGQPVKVQLASEEEAEAAAPLNGSEVACVSELTLQTLKVPPPPATSAVYVDPGGNSLPVHIRLPATEQEYLALPPQLISDNSRDKPLRLIVCKSGFAMGMVRDIQSAIAAGMWAPANIVNLFTKLLNMAEPLNKLTGLTNAIIAVVLVVRGVK